MSKFTSPIKGFIPKIYPSGSVTQWFGENFEMYKAAIGTNGHNGIDIVAPWGTPIFATQDGRVVEVKDDAKGYGKHIRILSDDGNGGGIEWTYGHNSLNLVKVSDTVVAGQHIANMGNTGFVVSGATPFWKHNPFAGTHLHLGARKFIYDNKGWAYYNGQSPITIPDYDNGFKGAFDFAYMFGETDDTPLKITLITQAIGIAQKILAHLTSVSRSSDK